MKKLLYTTLTALLLFCLGTTFSQAAEHRLGGGVNYWYSIDELKGDDYEFDRNGFGIIGSYQYWGGLLGVEFDLEVLPDFFDETSLSPQAFLLIGKGLYAGIGIGTTYTDGDFANEPFYALRAGFCLELLPNIYADLYTTYRFNDVTSVEETVDDIDTNTLFLGAMVRIALL